MKNYLGPKMEKIGVKIMFWDLTRSCVISRSKVMLGDEEAGKYIYGIAFHWYSGDHFEQLEMFHRLYPDKALVFSEGCYEYSLGEQDTVKIGEKYAHDMIGNFNHYCNLFCDWNLLLDERGGRIMWKIIVTHLSWRIRRTDTLYVHDSYYYIGHFSRYVKKGAKRIGSSKWTSAIDTVSFKNPDGSIVSIVLNTTEDELPFSFSIQGKIVKSTAEAHSIGTYIFYSSKEENGGREDDTF